MNDQPSPGNPLESRLRRIYAAVDANVETDITRIRPRVDVVDNQMVGWEFDPSGGLSEEAIRNNVYLLVHNIANLFDHSRSALKARHGKGAMDRVDEFVKSSRAASLIYDLSNEDKHGALNRSKTWSGTAPRLPFVMRVMRITSQPGADQTAGIFFSPGANMSLEGEGKYINTGPVMDETGARLGDLHDLLTQGLTEWETFLSREGLL